MFQDYQIIFKILRYNNVCINESEIIDESKSANLLMCDKILSEQRTSKLMSSTGSSLKSQRVLINIKFNDNAPWNLLNKSLI